MRIALAILMVLHGIAHLPGFTGAWRPAMLDGMPYGTSVLLGRIDLGDAGIRLVGVCWLVAAIAFVVTGLGALAGRDWWVTAARSAAIASLALALLQLPDALVGAAADVAVLTLLTVGRHLGWLGAAR